MPRPFSPTLARTYRIDQPLQRSERRAVTRRAPAPSRSAPGSSGSRPSIASARWLRATRLFSRRARKRRVCSASADFSRRSAGMSCSASNAASRTRCSRGPSSAALDERVERVAAGAGSGESRNGFSTAAAATATSPPSECRRVRAPERADRRCASSARRMPPRLTSASVVGRVGTHEAIGRAAADDCEPRDRRLARANRDRCGRQAPRSSDGRVGRRGGF